MFGHIGLSITWAFVLLKRRARRLLEIHSDYPHASVSSDGHHLIRSCPVSVQDLDHLDRDDQVGIRLQLRLNNHERKAHIKRSSTKKKKQKCRKCLWLRTAWKLWTFFGLFLARSVASVDESCTKNEQNRIYRSKSFLELLFSSFFCRTRFDDSKPFWKRGPKLGASTVTQVRQTEFNNWRVGGPHVFEIPHFQPLRVQYEELVVAASRGKAEPQGRRRERLGQRENGERLRLDVQERERRLVAAPDHEVALPRAARRVPDRHLEQVRSERYWLWWP